MRICLGGVAFAFFCIGLVLYNPYWALAGIGFLMGAVGESHRG